MITLLEKKGKDNKLVSSYRPVSLLNTDYKILTKVLSNRLGAIVNDVIHPDQFGFIKGRYIGEVIRFTEDLIEMYDRESIPGILLQLDFAKAFDSVEWPFLFSVLKKFNLGKSFISWIKCCYNDIFSCVMNNGYITNWFKIERGMRQGCPISGQLFLFWKLWHAW